MIPSIESDRSRTDVEGGEDRLTSARREGMERALFIAERVRLPDGYQYGRDALENFNFGKNRAADAIRAELYPASTASGPSTPSPEKEEG